MSSLDRSTTVNCRFFTSPDVISSIRYDAIRDESVRIAGTATLLPFFRLRDNSFTALLIALSRVAVFAWAVAVLSSSMPVRVKSVVIKKKFHFGVFPILYFADGD
jgi:hypothetical protein